MRIKNSIMKVVFVALIGMLSASVAQAQYTYKFKDELGTYKVTFTPANSNTMFEASYSKPLNPKTHELRISSTWGGTDDMGIAANHTLSYIGNSDDYPQNALWGPQHWYGATIEKIIIFIFEFIKITFEFIFKTVEIIMMCWLFCNMDSWHTQHI